MEATVTRIDDGIISVRLRRATRTQQLSKRYADLRVGDKVAVARQPNNPYLVRLGIIHDPHRPLTQGERQ